VAYSFVSSLFWRPLRAAWEVTRAQQQQEAQAAGWDSEFALYQEDQSSDWRGMNQ
jgi:hypothetical protein